MAWTDIEYYKVGEIQISGIQTSDAFNNESVDLKTADVNSYIEKFERKFMRFLLGKELYDNFIETKTDPKWDILKNILIDEQKELSIIARYVYCKYIYATEIKKAETGDYIDQRDGVYQISVRHNYIKTWNSYVDDFWDKTFSIQDAISTLGTLDTSDWGHICRKESGL